MQGAAGERALLRAVRGAFAVTGGTGTVEYEWHIASADERWMPRAVRRERQRHAGRGKRCRPTIAARCLSFGAER